MTKHLLFLTVVVAVAALALALGRERAREYETWRDYVEDEEGMFV